jgi:hypothetical protein
MALSTNYSKLDYTLQLDQLLNAIAENNLELVMEICKCGYRPFFTDLREDITIKAANKNHASIMMFLKEEFNVAIDSMLGTAIWHDSIEALNCINENYHLSQEDLDRSLLNACKNHRYNSVKTVLKFGANPRQKKNLLNVVINSHIIGRSDDEILIVKELIKYGVGDSFICAKIQRKFVIYKLLLHNKCSKRELVEDC